MKPLEILLDLNAWSSLKPAQILASPAFAMPCRFADQNAVMRLDAPAGVDELRLLISFADEQHVLGLRDSARYESLHALWAYRAETPAPILLALVEKECASLLQTLENAVRCQLRIVGIAEPQQEPPSADEVLYATIGDVSFSLTRSAMVDEALGSLRNIDLTHQSVRAQSLVAEIEHAVFMLPSADFASLAPGDALLLPEVGTVKPRFIVENTFVIDENGVAPYRQDDSRLRVRNQEPGTITLGTLLDSAQDSARIPAAPGPSFALRLVNSAGRTLATGHFEKIAGQAAFITESLASN